MFVCGVGGSILIEVVKNAGRKRDTRGLMIW